jgi:hypothetical protein
VSVIAEAENSSNTRAYQTDSGDTTKAPLSIRFDTLLQNLRPNHYWVHSMTSVEHFRRKRIAVNQLHTPVFGVPQHQTIKQGKMAYELGQQLVQ